MTDIEYVQALWLRAQESIKGAEVLVDIDPNAAASRSYYAAYHAVSALFGLEDRTFKNIPTCFRLFIGIWFVWDVGPLSLEAPFLS